MFSGESLSKNFIRGLAILDSYIKLNNKIHLQDINIISEQFFGQLLNILYGWELRNANTKSRQMPGYDLISEKNKLIIQVTSECRTEKVKDCFRKLEELIRYRAELVVQLKELERSQFPDEKELEMRRSQLDSLPDLTGYRLRFLFLTTDAVGIRKSTNRNWELPSGIHFDPKSDVMDFVTLGSFVHENCLNSELRKDLEEFISTHADLFLWTPPQRDHVQDIIDEYAGNYEGKLFLHRYPSSEVKLKNLYVEPVYREFGSRNQRLRDIAALLCDFLWQRPENDKERILFIEGDAAIGKTSLVSWLCHHYCRAAKHESDEVGEAIFLNRKIVCVRLRELKLSRSSSAMDTVLNYLQINSIRDFRQRYRGAILILDGADELRMVSGDSHRSTEEFLLDLQRSCSDHKIIITTRPKFLDLSSEDFNGYSFLTRRVELLHYDHNMRVEWLENYKKCGEAVSPATEEYIITLPDDLAEGVADTPLALYLLAGCDLRDELRGNNWALYREIFSKSITNGVYNLNFVQNGLLMKKDMAQTNYRVVQNIAYRMFQNAREDRYYLNSREIDEVISRSDLNGLTKDQVRSTCVLCAYWKNTSTLGALEFYHNNIRDFFLCEYISESLIRCINEHSRDSVTDALIAEFCRLFCWGDVSGTTWEQAFAFLQLRLRYEKRHPGDGTLYAHLRQVENLPHVIWRLSVSTELWGHPSPVIPYVSAKRVFTNSMMLMRILMDTDSEAIKYWRDTEQLNTWLESGLFRDWHSILRQSVKLSAQQRIGIASKASWSGFNWSGCSLGGVDLSEAALTDVCFDGADLSRSSFRNAVLSSCQFRKAKLQTADFTGAILDAADFSETDLASIPFLKTTLRRCVWNKATLLGNRFVDSVIDSMVLGGSNLYGMHFSRTHISNCRFPSCTFSLMRSEEESLFENVEFSNASLSCAVNNSRFLRCRFDGGQFNDDCRITAEFIESDFVGVRWQGSLRDARFYRCNFNNCFFSSIHLLQNVEFVECSFVYADFRGVKLHNVRFDHSDLRNATFIHATLDRCTMTGASTNLQGAKFTEAKNLGSELSEVNFYGAMFYNSLGFDDCKCIAP